jgi:hypothetical protein
MSDESESGVAAPEPRVPGWWSRVLPSWARRRPLVAGVTAGVLAAAVIAAAVAKYLPGAKGTPVSTSASSTVRTGICKWSNTANTDEVDAPVLSQAGRLAADIAMARDVLAGLRHTGPGPA